MNDQCNTVDSIPAQLYRDMQEIGKIGGWEFVAGGDSLAWTEGVSRILEVGPGFTLTINRLYNFCTASSRQLIEKQVRQALEKGESFDTELDLVTARGNQRCVRIVGTVDPSRCRVTGFIQDITERNKAEQYIGMAREVLQILNETGELRESIQRVLAVLKDRTGFDAVGIRLQEGEDFPYYVQRGFSINFLLLENTLVERSADGSICRNQDGLVSLECTCGLVLSGKTDPTHPLFTSGGSCWTNDSFPLLEVPACDDPRNNPRNRCIHEGYASVALIPIRTMGTIIGLLQFNDRRTGCFTKTMVELFEEIADHIGENIGRKRAVEKIRLKDAEIEQLIYTVSHDLRSPLVTIKTFIRYLGEDLSGDQKEKTADDLLYISNAADKMELMLNELLQMSRVGKANGQPVKVPLSVIVNEVLEALAGAIREQNVSIFLPEEDVVLHGEKQRLYQIWQNLIENSIKYSGDAGAPEIRLGSYKQGDNLCFYVRDNGIGIEPHYREKIFRIFEKLETASTGVGIGLPLVQRIVERYGGRIWVESEGIGKGSCFYFSLPQAVWYPPSLDPAAGT